MSDQKQNNSQENSQQNVIPVFTPQFYGPPITPHWSQFCGWETTSPTGVQKSLHELFSKATSTRHPTHEIVVADINTPDDSIYIDDGCFIIKQEGEEKVNLSMQDDGENYDTTQQTDVGFRFTPGTAKLLCAVKELIVNTPRELNVNLQVSLSDDTKAFLGRLVSNTSKGKEQTKK